MGHDALRQVSYLRQCLMESKRPLGLFLGAGCPVSIRVQSKDGEAPLIPDVAGLSDAVATRMQGGGELADSYGAILDQLDGMGSNNVEMILSHIRSLSAVAGDGEVRGLTKQQLLSLDRNICEEVEKLVNVSLPDRESPFHKVAAWIGAIKREAGVHLFTTNYDLLLEQALEESRVPYFDGFVGSRRTFFDTHAMEEPLPTRWARVWKLHGSINWILDPEGTVSRGLDFTPGASRLIHPSHLKYQESRRMPYLAMIDRLRDFLKQPSAFLVVVGYSFRDEHLNEVIVEGLQANPTAASAGLLFGGLDSYQDGVGLCRHPNLSLLARDKAIVGTVEKSWSQKRPDEIYDRPVGINWVIDDEDQTKEAECVFQLGDFSVFGAFLADIVGDFGSNLANGS